MSPPCPGRLPRSAPVTCWLRCDRRPWRRSTNEGRVPWRCHWVEVSIGVPGVPPVIHFSYFFPWISHEINHPAIGVPPWKPPNIFEEVAPNPRFWSLLMGKPMIFWCFWFGPSLRNSHISTVYSWGYSIYPYNYQNWVLIMILSHFPTGI